MCIGPARPSESYLKVETIVQAALGTKSDAIHPGYGFLSERAALARLCETEGVVFIGPTAAQIEAVGDKLRARAEAEAADVPVVPGGAVESADEALALARDDRRATSGQGGGRRRRAGHEARRATGGSAGGDGVGFGRGRRRIWRRARLPRALRRAAAGMWKCRCWAMVHGRVIHLGERDCSVQRRYQKLIEETPAPGPVRTRCAAAPA